MFASDRKPRPSAAPSAEPKLKPKRATGAPPVNPTWLRWVTSIPAGGGGAEVPATTAGTADSGRLMRKCAACGGAPSGGGCPECDEGLLQRKGEGAGQAGIPATVPQALRSGAEPLDAATRGTMERSLGHDLSGVRVHHGAEAERSARDVGALAYTVGSHVVFGAGRYAPSSSSGRELLAHELVHVVQQSRGSGGVQGKLTMSTPGDADEQAADAMAPRVARGEPVSVAGGGGGAELHRSVNATPRIQPSPPNAHARALLVHLHANEQNAADVAAQMFRDRCTNFVDLSPNSGAREVEVTDGTRTIEVDPNRIFTPEGRRTQVQSGVRGLGVPRADRAAVEASLRAELDVFANDLIDKIGRGRGGPGGSLLGPLPVVAFHNNVQGDARTPFVPGAGGTRPGLSIRSYLRTDPLQPSGFRPLERNSTDPANPPHLARGQSEEDFFVATDAADFAALSTGAVTSTLERNVALQSATVPNDGSLSVATAAAARDAAAAGTLPTGTTQAQANRYLNIEAGRKSRTASGAAVTIATQTAMAEDALDLVGAGLRSSGGCGPAASTGTTAPVVPNSTGSGAVQRKLSPTPEPDAPRLMRQEEGEGATRVVSPTSQVDGTAIGGNNPVDDGWLDWFLRLIEEILRVLSRLATQPPARTPQAVPASSDTCLTFANEAALNARKATWQAQLTTMATPSVAPVIAWIVGSGSGPVVTSARDEARQQMRCMLNAMRAAGVANLPGGAPTLGGSWVVSGTRNFADQNRIWTCKYNFPAPVASPPPEERCEVKFGRVTPAAIAACPTAGLVVDGVWDRGNSAHRTCWGSLSEEQRQREILTTSSPPGLSRHHQGTDFDLFSTNPALFEAGRTFADAYSWLQANAIQYGFVQSFDPFATFMALGYTEERWHWSYYPIAQALLEFAADHLRDLEAELLRLWSTTPGTPGRFSFIQNHWQEFLFNVHQTPTSPVMLTPPPATAPRTTP